MVTSVNIKAVVFWDVTPCSLENRHQHFGETGRQQIYSNRKCSYAPNVEAASFSETSVPSSVIITY